MTLPALHTATTMQLCTISGALGGLVASGVAQHSANARASVGPGPAFKAALPPRSLKVLTLRYNKQEHGVNLQMKKDKEADVL